MKKNNKLHNFNANKITFSFYKYTCTFLSNCGVTFGCEIFDIYLNA